MHARRQGRAQQGAEVARILQTIEGEHKRGRLAAGVGCCGYGRHQGEQNPIGMAGAGGRLQHCGGGLPQLGRGRQARQQIAMAFAPGRSGQQQLRLQSQPHHLLD